MPSPRHALVFDGHCRLCRRSVALVRVWDRDGRIECLPYQDPGVLGRFPMLSPEACARAIQLVGPDGRVAEGAAAVEGLLRLLPRGGALAWTLRVPGMRALADRAYRWVARHRLHFGCAAHGGASAPAPRG